MTTVGAATVHGLRLRSEIALPGLTPAVGGRPDVSAGERARDAVDITLGPPGPVPDDPPRGEPLVDHTLGGRRQYAAARTAQGVCFRVPGFADFDLDEHLTRIHCRPDPRPPPEYLPIMLTGNVLSFLLCLAGGTVLHAGAVEVDGGAVAVVGPSGVGKSTLTAWLCTVGARLVTDDLLRIEPEATCHRGGPEIRLRERAASLAPDGEHTRTTVDGRLAVGPPGTRHARMPLRAVVVPRPLPDAAAIAVRELDPMAAALLLAGVPRTTGWRITPPQQQHFLTATAVAQRVPVLVVDLPWGPPFRPETACRLLELLGLAAPHAQLTAP